ncbi:hypothetical protein BV22DRAFT_1058213, partial [Leucogyrophana mollusca]
MQAQTYQRAVRELEYHWLRLELGHDELLAQVSYLADEIVLEKRLGIAQLCLLLAVLVFMGFTRGSRGEPVGVDQRRVGGGLVDQRRVGGGPIDQVRVDQRRVDHKRDQRQGTSVREWGRRKLSLGMGIGGIGVNAEWVRGLRSRSPPAALQSQSHPQSQSQSHLQSQSQFQPQQKEFQQKEFQQKEFQQKDG